MRKIFLVVTMLFIFNLGAKANTCDSKEVKRLTELANRVKVNYEYEKTNLPDYNGLKVYDEKLNISIYNVVEDIYIIMTNNVNDEEEVILNSDTDEGKYTLVSRDFYNIVEYNINIYARKDACKSRKLKTIKFIKPKRNQNFLHEACKGNENIPVCNEFITKNPVVDTLGLSEYIENYKKGKITSTTTKSNNKSDFNIKDYQNYIIIGSLVVVGGAVALIIIKKKRGNI